jgi:hypothetical protein
MGLIFFVHGSYVGVLFCNETKRFWVTGSFFLVCGFGAAVLYYSLGNFSASHQLIA